MPPAPPSTAEHRRLAERLWHGVPPWRRWGCYVADRAWGTVREDYSADGDAWRFVTHDMARRKAFWNTHDPILKERYFGLTSWEGNHGEDVKEYYFYLDNTPTHSYMRMLYKYPQAAFPYRRLLEENAARNGHGLEFELLDTGVFDEDRYFDIFVEYAKNGPEDICIRIEACNRGPDAAPLHLIPQLWFRNMWAWGPQRGAEPSIALEMPHATDGPMALVADDRRADR